MDKNVRRLFNYCKEIVENNEFNESIGLLVDLKDNIKTPELRKHVEIFIKNLEKFNAL
jgi:hypothetical protein